MKGSGAATRSTDKASTPGSTAAGECGVGVVAGAQQQAAAEHEPACGRGGCCRGRGVRACERAQRVGACAMAGVLARLRRRREGASWCWREAGLMRERGSGAVTGGGLRVLGRGSFGVLLRGGGRYEGNFRDDRKHGRGIYTYANKDR
jgi:hypothetical protein